MELLEKYDKIMSFCFELFKDKNKDYGPTWLLYRDVSLNDEIWRKAKRIRTLEDNGDNCKINEGRDAEYVGIINYCIMFLIRLNNSLNIPNLRDITDDTSVIDSLKIEDISAAYSGIVNQVRELMIKKNSDYGDAWQSMSLCSMTDQVIIRVFRIRKIMANNGQCAVSEGITSQLHDIINYCIFALIKMDSGMIAL